MTQTVPRLMSFPTERTEILLRFESGLAVGQALLCATSLDLGSILLAFGRKPGGIEKAFGLAPHLKFTWAHAIGYPLEDFKGGGQRPRLKFEKLFHKDQYGVPLMPDPAVDEALKQKGMIQEQAPLPGRIEEIDQLAASSAATRAWSPGPRRRSAASSTTRTGTSARGSSSGLRRSSRRAACRTTPRRCARENVPIAVELRSAVR